MNSKYELSIVIPFYNEADNAPLVLREVRECQPDAEVIAVDDGSFDGTFEAIKSVAGVTILRAGANRGQSAALYAGLCAAKGGFIATMDGDGQNDPADFARMLAILREGKIDVVYGFRKKRSDKFSKRAASKIANSIRRAILDDGVRDAGCGIKMFRREAVQYLFPFNGMHRYMAAIFKKAGLKIEEIPVGHRPRSSGKSKYTNWDRALRGIYDLFGVAWLLRRKVHYPTMDRFDPK
jgi:dolichol-phosphate mannosyltransferase